MNRFHTKLLLERVGSSLWKMFFHNYCTKSIGDHKYKEFSVDPLIPAGNKEASFAFLQVLSAGLFKSIWFFVTTRQ